ncbi:MAG: hypothetical protein WDO16_20845 [Bacteroidota bacterium]
MKPPCFLKIALVSLLLLYSSVTAMVAAQDKKSSSKIKKASRKVETGFEKNNQDTLAQGYFDLGESYYQKRRVTEK